MDRRKFVMDTATGIAAAAVSRPAMLGGITGLALVTTACPEQKTVNYWAGQVQDLENRVAPDDER